MEAIPLKAEKLILKLAKSIHMDSKLMTQLEELKEEKKVKLRLAKLWLPVLEPT